jgi:hypothetical protein
MTLGLSLSAFTMLHVIIAIAGLVSGGAVLFGMLKNREYGHATPVFLASTVMTSVTGFMFPVSQLLPPHIVGIISLVLLAAAITAYYAFHLSGTWRWIYIVTAVMAFYLNVFVAVAQSFLKLPNLNALAPTGSEPPFAVAQIVVVIIFIGLGFLAVKRFHPAKPAPDTPV